MSRFCLALAITGLMACNGSLADLWQPPPGLQTNTVPSVKVISGRISALVSKTVPRQVAPTRDERINVIDHVALGDDVWIVRTRIPLENSKRELTRTDGRVVNEKQLSRLIDAAPRKVLGLILDESLRVITDQKGLGRAGRVVVCDGDPVESALSLRACLALAYDRGQPVLEFESPKIIKITSDAPDAGPTLVEQSISTDAGETTMVDGGGAR